jgi:hypothetical protein
LVIVQFVSQQGVGVFVRGEYGIKPNDVEQRFRPYAARLKKALEAEEFFFERKGATPVKYFFSEIQEVQ